MMLFTSSPRRNHLRFVVLTLLSLFGLLSGSVLPIAANVNPMPSPAVEDDLPEQLGTVVYQTQTESASRIYIIANGHRSAISGANRADVLQAQVETFRIGEWLISQNRIELLLPEGFFGEKNSLSAGAVGKSQLDNQWLQEALTDTSRFVNAELLLHKNYGIGLNQVEDRKLYRQVRNLLRSTHVPGTPQTISLQREIDYLQKLRTANILQAAPAVIADVYQQGRIEAPNAMLTIGLAHLEDIISFLEAGEISIAGLQTADSTFPSQRTKLALLEKQVNITVIVPRALMTQRI